MTTIIFRGWAFLLILTTLGCASENKTKDVPLESVESGTRIIYKGPAIEVKSLPEIGFQFGTKVAVTALAEDKPYCMARGGFKSFEHNQVFDINEVKIWPESDPTKLRVIWFRFDNDALLHCFLSSTQDPYLSSVQAALGNLFVFTNR